MSERVDTAVAPVALDTASTRVHTFRVALAGPLDIPASVEMFRRSGDDLLDRWDGTHLVRTLRIGGRVIPYAASVAGTVAQPALDVRIADAGDQAVVEAAIRRSFIIAPPEYGALLASDPIVAALDARYPGLRQVRQFDLLTALIRSISAQQVNLRWAATTRRRLAEALGERHTIGEHEVYSLDPARLAQADTAAIRALQFTTRKSEYIQHAAEAIASGRLDLVALEALADSEVITRLTALRGIGRWTAEWILARTLGRPVVVAGDLGVRKVVGLAYLGLPLPSEDEVRRATAHWGPAANVAQTLLLREYAT